MFIQSIYKMFIILMVLLCTMPCLCRRRRYKRGDDCHEDVISMYEVSFFGDWSRKTFPKMYPRYRPHAQWSKVVGRTHDATYKLWREGELASPTLQKFVEEGNSRMLEKDAQGFNGTFDCFTAAPIRNGVGRTSVRVMANGKFNKISFIAKIVPSPDWFVGIDSVALCRAGRWRRRIHMTMRPLDGGTDKGLTYTSPNWPSHPQEPVYHILPTKPRHPASPFYNPQVERVPKIAHVLIERIGEFVRRGKKKQSKFQNSTNTFIPTEPPTTTTTTTTLTPEPDSTGDIDGGLLGDTSYEKTDIIPLEVYKVTDYQRVGEQYNHNPKESQNKDMQTPPLLTQNDDSSVAKGFYLDNRKVSATKDVNLNSDELTTFPLTYETESEEVDKYIKPMRSFAFVSSSRLETPAPSTGSHMEPTEPTVPDYESRALFRDDYGQQRGILYSEERGRENIEDMLSNNKAIMDCLVTEWGAWGPCSKTCGFGVRMRKRQILQQAENGGSACPRVSLEALCGSMRTCGWKHFSMFAQQSPRRRRRHHRVRYRSHKH